MNYVKPLFYRVLYITCMLTIKDIIKIGKTPKMAHL